jgi:hypothetical protein
MWLKELWKVSSVYNIVLIYGKETKFSEANTLIINFGYCEDFPVGTSFAYISFFIWYMEFVCCYYLSVGVLQSYSFKGKKTISIQLF